jgi:hypothetical protein
MRVFKNELAARLHAAYTEVPYETPSYLAELFLEAAQEIERLESMLQKEPHNEP